MLFKVSCYITRCVYNRLTYKKSSSNCMLWSVVKNVVASAFFFRRDGGIVKKICKNYTNGIKISMESQKSNMVAFFSFLKHKHFFDYFFFKIEHYALWVFNKCHFPELMFCRSIDPYSTEIENINGFD